MVHGQVRGCNLSTGFTAGLRVTAKLPRVTRAINLVPCRINVLFKMIIYHLESRRGCARGGANSCAQGIGERVLGGEKENTCPHCFTSAVPGKANENCT